MEVKTELKLTYLQETKEAIKNAIISKGQSVSNDEPFRRYAEKILAIGTSATPILGELTITENGTYLPGEGLDGYSKVTVNVEGASSVTDVLSEQTIEFARHPNVELYVDAAGNLSFELVDGESYVVVWDGTEYRCTAAANEDAAMVIIGNASIAGVGDDTGEPFLIGYDPEMQAAGIFTTETTDSHVIHIYQKASGGGSGVEVCYVTFMSEDGVTELYKRAVVPGNHCADVIDLGLIEEQTKEPTNTEVFTQSGWSLTAGGSADASALLNVTEDRTVYAAFEASTRYYTVRFFDGEELKHTMQVPYNGTADYTIEKEGYALTWEPSNINITADTDCYAQWTEALVFVQTGTCGDSATWGLTSGGLLLISGTGAMSDYTAAAEQPWYDYASAINEVIFEAGITQIGANAIRDCTAVTAITIPESVISIGSNAFRNTSITSLELPNNLTNIPGSMCYLCANLKTVTMGSSVTTIGTYAFGGCSSLNTVTIPASVTLINAYAFSGSGLTSADFIKTSGWKVWKSGGTISMTASMMANDTTAANNLTDEYVACKWENA